MQRFLAVGLLTILGATAAADTITRDVPAAPGQLLEFRLDTGGGVTVTGWDQRQVSARVTRNGRDAGDIRVDVRPTSRGVEITSRYETRHKNHSSNLDL